MTELYSNAEDCNKLARVLYSKLKSKIEFYGSTHLEVISGKYHCLPRKAYKSYDEYKKDELLFSYKFLENGFLNIQVNDSIYKKASMGHKLAALSDLYEVISREYGEPTVFYTIKDDDENSINFEWAFIEKEETVDAFKNGTRFDDAEIDELIIIGAEKEKTGASYSLNKRTKEIISKTVGLPFEMLYLFDEFVEDFILYKKGKTMGYPENARIDGYPIATLEDIDSKISKLQEQSGPVKKLTPPKQNIPNKQ